ncbi:MAG: sulfate adenylyltransferase [Candidatus Aminicenantes bacterium]|uniref:Sulfate adenylyltransferase n=1 Tax=Candidatus Saccharicenans subterraneus TaxID=2508984 RepID=A0A3E2BLL8_9BACT|nr:sulfate adenylyltransferase [Candidatus Aminicenantes bacterium]RFT15552.1 MAG: Sulfate adenylyltransferase, dissimilatory-type [Candidatus Saccharicenans subterraneum]
MIPPHGGQLVNRLAEPGRKAEILSRSDELVSIVIDPDLVSDLENIATGVYSPLTGFLNRADFRSVLNQMRLSNDLPWTIPIVIDVDRELAGKIKPGQEVLLKTEEMKPVGVLMVEDRYEYDREEFSQKVYGTTDPRHPGVGRVLAMKEVLLGGPVELLELEPTPYDRYRLSPKETRILFREKGWKTVVGFQTRNTPHLGHEYVQKAALTFTDGLFINPVIGRKKKGDFRDEVILASYEELIRHYYLRERAVMAILKMEMRYAGPREAIHHAIIRKNFGCTHIIIGRDHAGVGNYYHPYAAQEIFEEFPDLGIVPLFFKSFFFCKKCGSIENEKTCPHDSSSHIQFSGTRIRDLLVKGEIPPPELMRPEVARIILSFDNPFND